MEQAEEIEIIEMPGNGTLSDEEVMTTIEAAITALVLSFLIVSTIFGNVLVIIAVFTYRPLQNVQNMFIVSLAVADIAVAVLVMPLSVANYLTGKWMFGLTICEMWLTCDVMCCTASILNLCAIALDRYWAIHDPINYARKRTLKRVLMMIALVWALSLLISAPPLIGWNDWPDVFTEATPCRLTEERGYVVYSASGSFFIPLIIMMTVYLKIFQAAKQRIRVKAKAAAKMSGGKAAVTNATSTTTTTTTSIPLKSVSAEVSTIAVAEDSTSSSVSPKASDEKENPSSVPPNDDDEESQVANQQNAHPSAGGRSLVRGGAAANPRLTSTVRHYMREKQKICLLKERRAARVLGIVMGVFVLCWLPFFLMYVILPFCQDLCPAPSFRIVHFIVWLGYVNSALNPVIYTVFNLDFRRAFSGILCKKR